MNDESKGQDCCYLVVDRSVELFELFRCIQVFVAWMAVDVDVFAYYEDDGVRSHF